MALPDSIIVSEEWISEHYLTTTATSGSFVGRVNALRKVWDDEEDGGHPSVRSRLREHASAIARAANNLGATDSPDGPATRELHATIRAALGYSTDTAEVKVVQAGNDLIIGDAVEIPDMSGLALVIVQAHAAASVEDILDPNAPGLLSPALVDGKPQPAVTKVVSALFQSDEKPPFVLVQAGRWVLLAERSRWLEGRWLAIDLGLVAERRDLKKGRRARNRRDHARPRHRTAPP